MQIYTALQQSGWCLRTCHVLLIFTLFFGSLRARTSGPILKINTMTCIYARKLAFTFMTGHMTNINVTFADKILIFAVLKWCLLQQSETV